MVDFVFYLTLFLLVSNISSIIIILLTNTETHMNVHYIDSKEW